MFLVQVQDENGLVKMGCRGTTFLCSNKRMDCFWWLNDFWLFVRQERVELISPPFKQSLQPPFLFKTILMASFKEQADEQIPEEEPFTFVTRKGKGKDRQTAAPSQPIKAPTPQFQEPAVNLPGWSTRKPAKIKKNSQRAKMMGSRGPEADEKTIEWGLNMIEERK